MASGTGSGVTGAERNPDSGSAPGSAVTSWWSRRSLRAKLTAAAAVIIAVGMVIAAGLLVWRLHSSLIANLDATITANAQTVAAEAKDGRLPRQLPDSGEGTPRVQVIADNGRILAESTNLDRPGVPLFTKLDVKPGDLRVYSVNKASDGEGPYQVAVLQTNGPDGPATVYAALATDDIQQSTNELTTTLVAGVPVLVLALALVGWFLVGRALQPVEAIRRQAATLSGTDLRRRLNPPPTDDELGRLTDTFNDLLGRIESSADRQRQFVADAAHELRSPIAALRTQLEVSVLHPETRMDTDRSRGLLTDTERLSRLVDDLLALARLDANPPVQRQPIDLDDLVLAEARRARDRGPRLDVGAVSAARVLGEQAALDRVVRNLLDNAARHARASITVRLTAADGLVTLVVADDGPGIPAADRERVFDRFIRLDDARSSDEGGAGLGLAIVRDVVVHHGGDVSIIDNNPGAMFIVTLPAAP